MFEEEGVVEKASCGLIFDRGGGDYNLILNPSTKRALWSLGTLGRWLDQCPTLTLSVELQFS